MNSDLAWLDMIDRLETGTQPSNTFVLAELTVSTLGKVSSIRTYEKGQLVKTINIPNNVIGVEV